MLLLLPPLLLLRTDDGADCHQDESTNANAASSSVLPESAA